MSATGVIYEPPEYTYSQKPEAITPSGIHLVSFSTLYGELRSWVKVKGEPAIELYPTPDAFRATWQEYRRLADPGAVLAACNHLYGLPVYFFWHIVEELVYVGVTHKPKEAARPAPGSIWYPDWTGPKSGVWIEK